MFNNFKTSKTTSINKFKSFANNEDGIAAVEFMLILPFLIALFFGSVELYGHLQAMRKLALVSASISDIVAQNRTISPEQLDALHPIIDSLMAPLDPGTIRYRISSVAQGGAGDKPQLRWQHINGPKNGNGDIIIGGVDYKVTKCKNFKNVHNINFPLNQTVVLVAVEYTYTAIFTNLIAGPTEYIDYMIATPRRSNTVELTGKTECSVS